MIEDAFFVEVLSKSGKEDEEVVVYADGFWQPKASKDKRIDDRIAGGKSRSHADDEVLLDDDDDDDEDVVDDDDIQVTNVLKPAPKSVFVDLTDDSLPLEEEDDDDDVVML